MKTVPRHLFIPETERALAYTDRPVIIGEGQTISQPYIVALMTELMDLSGGERVLEIGTGSGYQAAVLAETAAEVFSIEIKPLLHERAARALASLSYDSVTTKAADGYFGWEEYAPFDAIMITAAADHVPPPLLDQLKTGGYLIMPLGDPMGYQQLIRVQKLEDDYILEQITGVIFVPMTGTALGDPGR
jgi:protein-L-isoaspartate(D-aspartate) O-methyltransferase